jgi:hypothetical protein
LTFARFFFRFFTPLGFSFLLDLDLDLDLDFCAAGASTMVEFEAPMSFRPGGSFEEDALRIENLRGFEDSLNYF